MTDLASVLVVQTAFLGDLLLVVPLVKALRRAGASKIVLATRSSTAEAAQDVAGADEIVVIAKGRSARAFSDAWQTGRDLRPHRFSLALVPHRSLRSAIIARASGAPHRIGFAGGGGDRLHTKTVRPNSALPETHRNLSLLEAAGVPNAVGNLPWFTTPATALASRNRRIVVAPGSQWGTKRWPSGYFARVVRQLRDTDWHVTLTGSESESHLLHDIASQSAARGVDILAGAPWKQFRSVVDDASVVLANDNAAVHTANLLGTPVVAVFGPTVPEFGFAPRGMYDVVVENVGLECRPCDAHGPTWCPIGTHECMTGIHPSRVLQAVESVFERTHQRL